MATLLALFFGFLACSCAINLQNRPFWTQVTQLGQIPAPKSDAAGAYVDGIGFFVYGGLNGSAGDASDNPVNTFHLFNPDTRTWVDLSSYPNAPSARAEAMIWPTDSGVVVSGGRGPFRRGLDLTHKDTYQFVHNGGWVYLGESIHANRSTEAAVNVGTGTYTAYAFSGSASTLSRFVNRAGGLRVNTVSYTPAKGWQAVTLKHNSPVPIPRAHHCLVASPNGKSLFTYGGYTADTTGTDQVFGEVNYLGDLWEFKTNNNKWVQHFSYGANPGKRDNSKLIYDEKNDRLWLVGGSNWIGGLNDVWFYSFQTSTWTNVTSYLVGGVKPPLRQGATFFERVFEDRIEFWYFAGGAGEFEPPLNDMWKLTIPLNFAC